MEIFAWSAENRKLFPLSNSSFPGCTLPSYPRAADPGAQQMFHLLSTKLHLPHLRCQSLPQSTASRRSQIFDIFFWICVSPDPYPWYIAANQAAACLPWLFWEVITLPIHHPVQLIQAIFLIHGRAHSIAIFQVIWYFSIIIVSPFEDSDKGHQDIFSN